MTRRASFLALHRWLALGFAPLLLLQAVSGALLLFHQPLARMIDPAGMLRRSAGSTVSAGTMLHDAEAALPLSRARRLTLPGDDRGTVLVQLAGAGGEVIYASLDPGDGRVLRHGSILSFPLEALLQLHYRLLSGTLGMVAVMANGLALTLLSASGLASWWPGRSRIAASLAIRARLPGHIRFRHWHRSIGVAVAALALFSATSGVLLVAPNLIPTAQALMAAPMAQVPPTTVDRAVALAQERFPGAALHDLRFQPDNRLNIEFAAPERNSRAVHTVTVDLASGRIAHVVPAAGSPALWMAVLPLHSGESLGRAGRLLLLTEALALLFLAGSGPWMWWRARRPERKSPCRIPEKTHRSAGQEVQ